MLISHCCRAVSWGCARQRESSCTVTRCHNENSKSKIVFTCSRRIDFSVGNEWTNERRNDLFDSKKWWQQYQNSSPYMCKTTWSRPEWSPRHRIPFCIDSCHRMTLRRWFIGTRHPHTITHHTLPLSHFTTAPQILKINFLISLQSLSLYKRTKPSS